MKPMPLFIFVFLIIYGGMHAYAYSKAKSALSLGSDASAGLTLFMTLMVLVPILVHMQDRGRLGFLIRTIAYLGYTWMGFLLLFVSVFLAIDVYNLILWLLGIGFRLDTARFFLLGRNSFIFLTLIVVAIGGYSLFDAQRIQIERIKVASTKLPPGISRLTIAQISDVHLGIINCHRLLSKIIAAINKAKPDLLVSTGDMVDADINHINGLTELFKRVDPKYGKYAVMGNHDFYAGIDESASFIKEAGFVILRGEGRTVGGIMNLAGVDDLTGIYMGRTQPQSEKKILTSLPTNLFTILLKHRPDIIEDSLGLFDLQLSGHTHGGQIFPFRFFVRLFFPRLNGLHKLPLGGFLYISTGTGTWGPPMRFLIPPKVTIIEVVSSP